jgi:hypothetical protein
MDRLDDLLSALHSATITGISVLVREVRVRVGVLSKPVRIRVYYDDHREEPYHFELSALMQPGAGRSARETSRRAPTEAEALRRAVRMLTQDYEDAVRRGELPDDGWLVEGD